ncbi:probable RNA-binding protein CG14230 [Scaptodrosophila lebanonensis]|uniref:Probable RNA-binding protein CG14230 n=1 Tax=Drosophila lebanonensis TaxID=7225 RepID=A0A6J2TU85_DROLE|nr:probable RNA-binding protein CG14230 [Scaptodrosophila lebanonensis]
MGSTRFFLADLPSCTTEDDLNTLFQDYGYVERVELKPKADSNKLIAFVTLQIDDPQYCLNEVNWQKLHGSKLKVSLAKESFLDRLKRERDEEQQKGQVQNNAEQFQKSSSDLLVRNTQNKRRVFGEDEELKDDDIAPELLITKKRASTSIYNGKIIIPVENISGPLHIIEQNKKSAKQQLDAKSMIADQKRKQSLNKMKRQFESKKSAVQQALSSFDAGKAKKIKFSDAEEDDNDDVGNKSTASKQKKELFADDSEGEDDNIILPEYSGKKGERLVEMQSKQSLDPRFRITASFVDDQEHDANEEEEKPQESERNWQMGILEQVVGRKMDTDNAKAPISKKMLRFDPGKEEHQKLVRQKPSEATKTVKGNPTANEKAKSEPVSQAAFYVVTDTLKQSLNMRGDGFSLLEMFGSSHNEEVAQRQGQLEQIGREKIIVNQAGTAVAGTLNPFHYDSSESEDEGTENQPSMENEKQTKKSKKDKKPKPSMESFFIPKNDPRLKEGSKFFKLSGNETENHDYDQVRSRLKLLIKTKIVKLKKNQPEGVKKRKNKLRN